MAKKEYKSFHGYGVDVASHRTDDLDKMALAHLANKSEVKLLDLGCGALGFSRQAAKTGAEVLAVDIADFSHLIQVNDLAVEFRQGDLRDLENVVNHQKITDVLLQRSFHYLEYEEGKKLLSYLCQIVADKLFISVTGLESDIGQMYLGQNKNLSERFGYLTPLGKTTFNIEAPVCLYTPDELRSLLNETGWKVDELWVSAFKNIKVVCSH